MYFKIALNNVKKSFKDYTIYFLTLTFAVCIFYSFNSIDSQSVMADMNAGQTEYVKIMGQLISYISVGVSVILGGLIIYATKFLINKRKKEFGIYMILGMGKRKMSQILFFETLYIGVISLMAGLLLGMLFAQILSIFTAKLFAVQMTKYSFVISINAILKTILYFGIMYLLVMIFNIVIVSRYKLIDLLCADRKNEKVKIRNPYIAATMLIASIAVLGYAYYLINLVGLNFFDNRFRTSIVLGIIGTALFFYGIASVMFFILQKNKNLYLSGLNIFSIRQISSKFNTNFISMTVICLMLFVTIGTLSSGLGIKNSMEKTLENQTPFDATVQIINNENSKLSVIDALKQMDYNLENNCNYVVLRQYKYDMNVKNLLDKYTLTNDEKEITNLKVFETTDMIKVSEYNNMRKLKGEPNVKLNNDEVIVSSNYEPLKDLLSKYVKNENSVKIGDKEYKIKDKRIETEAFSTTPTSDSIFTLIVPDDLVNGMEPSNEAVDLNFSDNNKENAKKELTTILNNFRFDNAEYKKLGFRIAGETREMAYDDSRGLSAIILFIAVYMGIVFLLSSAAVLALQQLSQCNDSLERYKSLRKIGATKSMINRSIFKQVTIFFLLPLALSIVHSYVGINVVNKYLIALGSGNKFEPIIVTALMMIIVYGGYLYATYIAYRNMAASEYN
ncbi:MULTISPECIES: FtsX-like permease family protein [unclassified Clostridium]|uniref:FtsX-like permease family protein n=1 Tax=unclassified Clostridium TaxID=2614128 RepID=UPI0002979FCA|nr:MULTISPECIES: FtsX-like permease family protein [unclassified Clostridium]EKQ51253.1 MAG: putative permease [Clostridium sp. Maddingley MBC34-26]